MQAPKEPSAPRVPSLNNGNTLTTPPPVSLCLLLFSSQCPCSTRKPCINPLLDRCHCSFHPGNILCISTRKAKCLCFEEAWVPADSTSTPSAFSPSWTSTRTASPAIWAAVVVTASPAGPSRRDSIRRQERRTTGWHAKTGNTP